jgi:hypothetical protein
MAPLMSSRSSGTAVVVALTATGEVTQLTLRHPSGERSLLLVPTSSDETAARADAAAVRRPLAVRMAGRAPYWSVLLGTSRRGPVRRPVSLESALALCGAGVHTVVVMDDPAES